MDFAVPRGLWLTSAVAECVNRFTLCIVLKDTLYGVFTADEALRDTACMTLTLTRRISAALYKRVRQTIPINFRMHSSISY